ncbi:MAG: hypothetical protein PF484_02640 [Bacteroidales bacterium]|jgi:hypothetical protein|nr:hypothetical protein [Bacteroidales bacterium]
MDFINELKKERAILSKRLDAIEALLDSYDSNVTHITNVSKKKDENYPSEGSYLTQIAYVIKREGRFLHNREIADALKAYSNKEMDFLKRRISAVLSKAKEKEGNLTSIRVGASIRNTFWGSIEWLDENKEPFKDHMYDTKYIVMARKEGINI